jgi:hypothetical protein
VDPLHNAIEEFAAEGHTHIACFCSRYRVTRMRPMNWLPLVVPWGAREAHHLV